MDQNLKFITWNVKCLYLYTDFINNIIALDGAILSHLLTAQF